MSRLNIDASPPQLTGSKKLPELARIACRYRLLRHLRPVLIMGLRSSYYLAYPEHGADLIPGIWSTVVGLALLADLG